MNLYHNTTSYVNLNKSKYLIIAIKTCVSIYLYKDHVCYIHTTFFMLNFCRSYATEEPVFNKCKKSTQTKFAR